MLDSFTSPDDTATPWALTVPQVLATVTAEDAGLIHLVVTADGWLIGHFRGERDGREPVVTEWKGEGSGKAHGHPALWRQKYRRGFQSREAAERRVAELLRKHGGAHGEGAA